MPVTEKTDKSTELSDEQTEDVVAARRKFLASCGKFAIATPPAVALLLSSAQQNFAAASGAPGRRVGLRETHADNGFGNGGGDGVPGNSDFRDNRR